MRLTNADGEEEVVHPDPDYDGAVLYCRDAVMTAPARLRPDGFKVGAAAPEVFV